MQLTRTAHVGIYDVNVVVKFAVLGLCLGCPSLPLLAENVPPPTVIKVCGMSMEFANIVKSKCSNGDAPQIVEQKNIGALNLPTTAQEAKRAAEQMYEVKGLRPGETDFHKIDRFTLSCGEDVEYRYFDIYHCEK